MDNKIKFILLALLATGGVLLACYVQSLRAENLVLTEDNQRLHSVNISNQLVITSMQARQTITDTLLNKWQREKQALYSRQADITKQLQKELQTNEDFKTWAGRALPASAVRLLGQAAGS